MADEKKYKVKVTVGDATVEIEGEKDGTVEIVSALSKIFETRPPRNLPSPETGIGLPLPYQLPETGKILDVRSFFASKNPRSDLEATAVAAFYLEHLAPSEQRRKTINKDLLENVFKQANWRLPKVIGQTLLNTKNAGYLDSTSETGEYKLNPVGYNLVEHTLGNNQSVEPKKLKRNSSKRH